MFGRLLTVSAQRLITLHKDRILVIHGTCVNWTRFSYTGRCTMLSSWTYNNDNDKIFLNNNNNGSMQVHDFTVNYIRLKQRFLECKLRFHLTVLGPVNEGLTVRLTAYTIHDLLPSVSGSVTKLWAEIPRLTKHLITKNYQKNEQFLKKKAQTHINSLLNFTEQNITYICNNSRLFVSWPINLC